MDRTFLDRVLNYKPPPSEQDVAWIELSNLYLEIEAKRIVLNRYQYLRLNELVDQAYPKGDEAIREWWYEEFYKLPGWRNV